MKRIVAFLALFTTALAVPASAQQIAAATPQAPRQKAEDLLTVSVLPVAPAASEKPVIVKAAQNLRAGTVLSAADLITDSDNPAALSMFIGMEVKRSIYTGKPLSLNDVGAPTAVERNAIVMLEFVRGPLVITTEGRALDSGALGERVRIMNLTSKVILSAVITGPNKAVTQ